MLEAHFSRQLTSYPPSDRTQEFKDGVIWADCLTLLASDSVVLVTSDKAFYQDRKYEKGLARNLQEEASGLQNQLQILSKLSELLKSIRKIITLNEDSLDEAFLKEYHERVYGYPSRLGFNIDNRQSVVYNLYATENPNVLFMEFSITYACIDISGEGRTDALLRQDGDGMYDPTNGRFTALRYLDNHFSYRMPDGTERETQNRVFLIETLVIGHKEVSNVIRYKLDGDDQ